MRMSKIIVCFGWLTIPTDVLNVTVVVTMERGCRGEDREGGVEVQTIVWLLPPPSPLSLFPSFVVY